MSYSAISALESRSRLFHVKQALSREASLFPVKQRFGLEAAGPLLY